MQNQAKNTATPTNQALGSQSLTWDEATFTWDEATGTWNNPYTMTNRTKNTATITNRAKS